MREAIRWYAVAIVALAMLSADSQTLSSWAAPDIGQATCPPLSGVRILYDTAAGQPPLSSRSTLANDLIARGAVIVENASPIDDPSDLADFNILWLTNMTGGFPGPGFTAIQNWLANGGCALFEADDVLTTNLIFNPLLDDVPGSDIAWVNVGGAAGFTTDLVSHPTTSYVDTLWFPGPERRFFSVTTPLVRDVNGVTIVAVNEIGPTRMIAVDDQLFTDSSISMADNRAFGNAVFDWFGELIPPDLQEIAVSPDSMNAQLLVGESTVMPVRIENTGSCDLNYAPFVLGSPVFLQSPIFSEDFEDGNFDEWNDAGGSGTKTVTALTAANGSTFSYHESNSGFGHADGIYQTLGAIQPEFVSFWVRLASTSLSKGYVVLRDSGGANVIFFYANSGGTFSVNPAAGDTSFPYQPQNWYWINFANINYTAKTFDFVVNGLVVKTGISFMNAGIVNNLDRVDLYNFHSGSEAWWDEISMGTPFDWLTADLTPGVLAPGTFVDIDYTMDATLLSSGVYNGIIRVESDDPNTPLIDVPVELTVDSPTGIGDGSAPAGFILDQNHPNPFNPTTTITYRLPEPADIRLAIYDVHGKLARVLADRAMPAGEFNERWDGTDSRGRPISSGVYFYRMDAGSFTQTRKMILLK